MCLRRAHLAVLPPLRFPDYTGYGLYAAHYTADFALFTYTRSLWIPVLAVPRTSSSPITGVPGTRAAGAPTDLLVVALPATGASAAITDRLPPACASRSWPVATATEALVSLVEQCLAACPDPLSTRLEGLDDDALRSLRNGALVPAPTTPPGGVTLPREILSRAGRCAPDRSVAPAQRH